MASIALPSAAQMDDGIRRKWKADIVPVYNKTYDLYPGSPFVVVTDDVDLSDYAVVSLRVINTLGTDVTLKFLGDTGDQDTSWLAGATGVPYEVVKESGNLETVILPDDLPILNYLKTLKVRISTAEAPTTGALNIYAICKR